MIRRHWDEWARAAILRAMFAVGCYLMALATWYGTEFAYWKMQEATDYFEYSDIIPMDTQVPLGEDLWFISIVEVKRPITINWLDILRCDFGDGHGFRRYSVAPHSEIRATPPTEPRTPKPWKYKGEIPDEPATCFIDSTPMAVFKYGLRSYHPRIVTATVKITQ